MRFREFKEYKKGPAGQAKGKDKMPKAKAGRTKHPLHGKLVGGESVSESIQLNEGARIQHAEDIVFWEGSKGAQRALQSLINLEKGGHQDVTVKWDGSPAIIFGRDEDGSFVLTDKSGFTAKGYDGKSKSAKELKNMFLNRSGGKNRDNPGYVAFADNMAAIFDEYERATPKDFRGFFKGDLLYFNTPPLKDGDYVFKPNVVEYRVDADSELGKRIGQSKTGVVIHRQVSADGTEGPLQDSDIFQGNEVLVVPPVTAQAAPKVNDAGIKQLKSIISKDAAAIDALLNDAELVEKKMKDLPDIFYTYTNSKVDTGLENLGKDFMQWLASSKVSPAKQKKVAEHIQQHSAGFNALWEVVATIQQVKDDIISQLDKQDIPVKQSMAGEEGGEGYVLAHPEGDIKLVPRQTFTRINRSIER
jgi:hypothetical protein